jgi:hypothetical protein
MVMLMLIRPNRQAAMPQISVPYLALFTWKLLYARTLHANARQRAQWALKRHENSYNSKVMTPFPG